MKRLCLCLGVLLSGCNLPGGNCTDDPGANHFALNPATGECWEFASSCDVPGDWPACGGGCNTNDDCGPGQICQAGVCATVGCAIDADCPVGTLCVNGVCESVGGGCMTDDDCVFTQHCDFTHPPMSDEVAVGVCVDNMYCSTDAECIAPQWCDLTPGDCDPATPGCGSGGIAIAGLCSRGPNPTGECFSNADCGSGQLCPAQYGMCTPSPPPPTPGDPLFCSSTCADACYDSSACIAGFRCNNNEICATPNPKPEVPRTPPVPPACAGWCVPL